MSQPIVSQQPASVGDGADRVAANSSLRHILLVGGTDGEWAALSDQAWEDRVDALGAYCASVGVPWLTVRAYATSDPAPSGLERWRRSVDGCDVIVDPNADGRQRFAEAMRRLDAADEVNEASVAATLYDPADSEPDLVVVVGPPDQLPPSLVWELAYAELVFLSVRWSAFDVDALAAAVADFSNRRRRFGGLDDE